MTKWIRLMLSKKTDPLEALEELSKALGFTYKILLILNEWGGVERVGGDEVLEKEIERAVDYTDIRNAVDSYAYGDGAICVLELFNGTRRVYATVYPQDSPFSELPYRAAEGF
jgi:hypothetical protein